MPENSAAQPEPGDSPGEFDFATSTAPSPRLKRRSLKAATPKSISNREIVAEAPPRSEAAAPVPKPPLSPRDEKNAGVTFTEPKESPSPRPAYRSTTTPQGSGTLYYSTGSRKEKAVTSPAATPLPSQKVVPPHETPESMKSTPLSSPTSQPTATARSVSPLRPTTAADYRSNIDRQAREQKSVGNVLAIIVYVLIGFFVLGASLAGYGTYVLSKQIHQQSVTMSDLDNRYAAQNQALNEQLKSTQQLLAQQQAQVNREQELILHQQEAINKLITSNEATNTALRQERQARAEEASLLRGRIRSLEIR